MVARLGPGIYGGPQSSLCQSAVTKKKTYKKKTSGHRVITRSWPCEFVSVVPNFWRAFFARELQLIVTLSRFIFRFHTRAAFAVVRAMDPVPPDIEGEQADLDLRLVQPLPCWE